MPADIFTIAKSGLSAARKNLSTASHNIANANVEGYSRQRVEQQTTSPVVEGGVVFGTGTQVKSVRRIHDEMAEKRIHKSNTDWSYHNERTTQLDQVQELFNEINSEGMNKILNRFFNSMRELATQPENETIRSIVRENARLVVKDFRRLADSMNHIGHSIDKKSTLAISELNGFLQQIGDLNIKIRSLEVSGAETGDLRDQRDQAVQQVSQYLKINTYEDDQGQFVVNARGLGSLVSGKAVQELITSKVMPDQVPGERQEGELRLFFRDRPSVALQLRANNGQLGALIETRNNELKTGLNRLDELAFNLAKAVNAIHRRGYSNQRMDQFGQYPAGSNTNLNFFAEPTTSYRAAETIALSKTILDDVNNIATALMPNSPGDNRVALAISKLQHEKFLNDDNATMEEHYLKTVGDISLLTSKSQIDSEQAQGILAQAKAIRERIAGVSIDEETANMVKFQHAYNAAARVIKVSDETFRSILDIV